MEAMIQSAAGLRSVAEELWRDGSSLDPGTDRFYGSLQAAPILLALGIELALKGWIYRESKCEPPYIHDLLCLFEKLEHETQELLEDAFQRNRGAGTSDDPIHEMGIPKSRLGALTVKDLICPRLSSLREILEEHRELFVNYRYPYERTRERPYPGVLNRVLVVLIETYWRTFFSQEADNPG